MKPNKVLHAVNDVAEELKQKNACDDRKILNLVLEVNKLVIKNQELNIKLKSIIDNE